MFEGTVGLSWESCLTGIRNLVPRAPGMWGKAGGQQKHDWGLIRTLLIISCLGFSECRGLSDLLVHQPCPVFSAFWCVNIWGPADSGLSNILETVNHSPSESIFEMQTDPSRAHNSTTTSMGLSHSGPLFSQPSPPKGQEVDGPPGTAPIPRAHWNYSR